MRILAVIICVLLCANPVFAFTFPTPDWGALLAEKTEMVNEVDFELYAEGPLSSAPYYGAKHEPKAGVYFGMIAENSQPFTNVGAYLTYFDVNSAQPDIYYPANNIISASNAITVVGMTVNNLAAVDYNVVKSELDAMAKYNKPMIIRFANEMNVSSLGDDPTAYIEAYRKVADMIHQYPNFATVWSPNDMGALDRPFSYYYPGDSYVDWIGVSSYQKKYFQGNRDSEAKNNIYFMTGDYSYTTNALKPIVEFMEENNINKPLMISEGGVTVKNKYGEELSSYAIPRFRNMYWNTIMKYPQVKLINYFNVERPGESQEYYISDKSYAVDILNEAAGSGAYLGYYGDSPDFVFTKANDAGKLVAKDGVVQLYTLAHFPKKDAISVNYRIDGSWYHAANSSPYKCGINLSSLSAGVHSLEISAEGMSKTYYFVKSEDSIEFIPKDANDIRIFVNGSYLQADCPPVIKDGRTLVPMRAIFEALGVEILWDDATKTVTATKGDTVISVQIGSSLMSVNGADITLDVPAQIVDGRTMVPARAVSEALGCSVGWNNEARVVTVNN